MTIEIQSPELEALILQRMRAGAFASIEDVLMQALECAPLQAEPEAAPENRGSAFTGADLVAAMQMSPCKDIVLEPSRGPMPVRDLVF
jgi:hypothetical protein